jgi:hypothetical protein
MIDRHHRYALLDRNGHVLETSNDRGELSSLIGLTARYTGACVMGIEQLRTSVERGLAPSWAWELFS